MKNITDCIINGKIEQLADANNFFKSAKSTGEVIETEMLDRETHAVKRIKGSTIKYSGLIEWDGYEYNHQNKMMTYYLHANPKTPGVNILEIPFSDEKIFPCFVSSGMLSGCVYAWFLVKDKVIFLHAGADNGNSTEKDKETRRCCENADILNGLRYSLNKRSADIEDCLVTEKLLEKVQDMVKAGQIIYPANQAEERDMGKVQTMSYCPSNGKMGECLCIIINTERGIQVSGMMTEKEGNSFENVKNVHGRILKVDTNGEEV